VEESIVFPLVGRPLGARLVHGAEERATAAVEVLAPAAPAPIAC
jgi:hypothetical protein